MKPTDFALNLSKFFSSYVINRGLSGNTVKSYQHAFKLLLDFCVNCEHIPIKEISFACLTQERITKFMRWMETERGSNPSTINQRLSSIHSFFKYVQMQNPDQLFSTQQILSIPRKRYNAPFIEHLSVDMLKEILQQPNTETRKGRRDLAMLSCLYDTGARVQELCDMCVRDLRFTAPAIATLTGKGGKSRCVPLMKNTTKLLKQYIAENNVLKTQPSDHPLFFNQRHEKLSRAGIAYVVEKYADIARTHLESIPAKVTPHVFRHTKAMHLYQSGIDIIYIRDILGHSSIETTFIYARIDTEMKRSALEKVYPDIIDFNLPDWNDDKDLISQLLNI